MASSKQPTLQDDDDLDDLDDFLDDFESTTTQNVHDNRATTKSFNEQVPNRTRSTTDNVTTASSTSTPTTQNNDKSEQFNSKPESQAVAEDEFARQLELGMQDLLRELETDPAARAQFESLVKGIDGFTAPTTQQEKQQQQQGSNDGASENTTKKPTLQDTIARTMERMKESGAQVDKEITNPVTAGTGSGGVGSVDEEDEFLASMMRQLQTAAGAADSGGTGDSDTELTRMLAGMMEQLTAKEILYDPIKELDDQYSDWLATHAATLSPQDLSRYELQRVVVAEIVSKFEDKNYDDDNVEHRKYIAERMQKMQESGAPPPDIMGELASGGDEASGAGGLGNDLDNCATQ
ncbi:Pex19 protein family-domain-containing protein [Lipomyces japonicus]|uniref:Pex19 protein family-domain-containing protein n=1 Tax=Lipomyces japonicus TaxID=56871 RepID=UPI0034CD3BF7